MRFVEPEVSLPQPKQLSCCPCPESDKSSLRLSNRFILTSSSSVGATARCGLWPVEQYLSIFPYLSPTLSISVYLVLHPSSLNLSIIPLLDFRNKTFFTVWGCYPTPNPQRGGPGYPFLSGSSPLTCLAWKALPVAYATASIALRIMWPHKPHHYVKVGTPSGGFILKPISILLSHLILRLQSTLFPSDFPTRTHLSSPPYQPMLNSYHYSVWLPEQDLLTSRATDHAAPFCAICSSRPWPVTSPY